MSSLNTGMKERARAKPNLELLEEIRELRRKKYTAQEIAKRVGKCVPTVLKYLKDIYLLEDEESPIERLRARERNVGAFKRFETLAEKAYLQALANDNHKMAADFFKQMIQCRKEISEIEGSYIKTSNVNHNVSIAPVPRVGTVKVSTDPLNEILTEFKPTQIPKVDDIIDVEVK